MTSVFAAASPEISIAPKVLFHVGPLLITNAQILGGVGVIVLLAILITAVVQIKQGKRNRFVYAILMLFESLYDTTVEVIGSKAVAKKVLPLAVTLMLFFLVNNWLGLLPFVGSVSWHGEPLLRGVAADMNTTFAFAIISMLTAQLWAVKRRGVFGNLHRYFSNPFKDPLHAVVGILEFIAEFTRGIALALRIFGNVFGGEVLLGVIAFLTGYAAPIALPVFYCLEMFVGAVQAYVFFMLTIAFISLGLPENDEEEHGAQAAIPVESEAAK
ncbi:MAG TPA: F0F1 ATP synthase subunit A [Candidatus Saccharimonadales bacterium]|jgi:F-type H+-transporting ATPase subunit a|nr:F0F1 ATP synthase subunit A [Candidatus Saccharimonadales bacterium]